MFTTVVQFHLPSAISCAEASKRFQGSAPKYKDKPGLIRKHYIVSDDGKIAGGIYHWKSRADAERMYNDEWRAFVTSLYGVAPVVQWFETPVIVDNVSGETIVASQGNAESRKAG